MDLSSNALAKESIAYRFESQTTIDDARARREEEWKAAYERIGQEPPKRQEELVDDGKTLYEKLEIQKQLKTEEWDQKMKLSNQWRGLGAEELKFLNEKAKEKREAEKIVEDAEKRELAEYREALASRQSSAIAGPSVSTSFAPKPKEAPTTVDAPAKRPLAKPVKKDMKSLMKGVVVKKKPVTSSSSAKPVTTKDSDQAPSTKKQKVEEDKGLR